MVNYLINNSKGELRYVTPVYGNIMPYVNEVLAEDLTKQLQEVKKGTRNEINLNLKILVKDDSKKTSLPPISQKAL